MLDGLLCSAVQGVAETVLGIYQPENARKKEDQSAQRLATQLDMPSSIQLVKRAQRTSTTALQMVSATSTSTPMAESIDHYSTIFNTSDYIPNFRAIRPDNTPNSPSHSEIHPYPLYYQTSLHVSHLIKLLCFHLVFLIPLLQTKSSFNSVEYPAPPLVVLMGLLLSCYATCLKQPFPNISVNSTMHV